MTEARAADPASGDDGPAANANQVYAKGLARACAGAVIFGLPLLMTMEMWTLGFAIHPLRLLVFVLSNFAVLVALSRFGGFEPTDTVAEDVLDALGAYAVGIAISALALTVLGLISPDTPLHELAGMIAVQSVPTSFGAMLARKQLGDDDSEKREEEEARSTGYGGQLFLMLAGALFLAFNVAPTEEVVLIGLKMTAWHTLALIAISLMVLHALVYAVGLPGREEAPEGYGTGRVFWSFTCPGYGIAMLVSLYVLWTFGRVDGAALDVIAGNMVVLGFPASVGAAIARLVV